MLLTTCGYAGNILNVCQMLKDEIMQKKENTLSLKIIYGGVKNETRNQFF